uniref:hypothetical protein n=1 Tax=Burkholderia arboris TaxID=488730 RepID=UPI003BEF2EB8
MSYQPRRSPVRHFLSDQMIAMGIEWRLLRVWFSMIGIVGMGALFTHSLIVAAVGLAGLMGFFFVLRRWTKNDPYARRKYLRYMRQADIYEPWPQIRRRWTGPGPNARPLGFGRDRLM